MFVTCILQMCGGRVIVQKYSVRNLKSLVKSNYPFHVMKYLFPQIGDLPIDNPAQNAEGYFRSAKVTGLIEKQFHAGQSAVLLYAGGVPGMAYLLENGQGKSMARRSGRRERGEWMRAAESGRSWSVERRSWGVRGRSWSAEGRSEGARARSGGAGGHGAGEAGGCRREGRPW